MVLLEEGHDSDWAKEREVREAKTRERIENDFMAIVCAGPADQVGESVASSSDVYCIS